MIWSCEGVWRVPFVLCDDEMREPANIVGSELRYPDRTGEISAITNYPKPGRS
jgi:hypothetical protein